MLAAVCDNDQQFISHLKSMLEESGYISGIESFSDMNALKTEILVGHCFDVVFMDFDWDTDECGIDLAELLYDHCPTAKVIYVTSYSKDYAQRMFLQRSNIVGLLCKPVDPALLEAYLVKMVKLNTTEQESFVLNNGGKELRFFSNDVPYLESDDHFCLVHRISGESVRIHGKISDIEHLLPQQFCRCHKSILVNLDFVDSIRNLALTLTDGSQVPVGRTHMKGTKERFFARKASKL